MPDGQARESTAAIEIEGLFKRYRGGGPLVPIPFRWGRRLERGRRMGHADDEFVDDADDDDDLDDFDADEDFEDQSGDAEAVPRGRETWALRDISIAIPPGARVALIGPDGGGKTTLLKILARTAIPTSGRAIVRGRITPPVQLLPGLMQASSSGRQNVARVADYQGISRREALSHTDEIAVFAELEEQIDRQLRTYSTNERQRLAFAIAVGLDPQIMLADEVVAVGDAHFRQRCLEEIERRTSHGMTLLLATHSMPLVQRLCTQAILIDAGEIVEYGPVDEVVREYLSSRRAAVRPAQSSSGREPESDGEEVSQHELGVSAAVYSVTGRPVEALATDDEALIEIALDVFNAPLTLACLLGLASPELVLRSSQPEAFDVAEPGRQHVSVRIPPGAIPPGSFRGRVTVFGFTEQGREVVGKNDSVFSLDVLESPGVRPVDQATKGKHTLSLSWSVTGTVDRV